MNPDDLRAADAIEVVLARAPKPGAAACCWARRSATGWPACAPCRPGIDQRSACRHPDWTGPDDLTIKILELREIHRLGKTESYVKIGARAPTTT